MVNLKNKSNAIKPLTNRELEVLKYIVQGKSNTDISEELEITIHTTKAHVSSILRKMHTKDRLQTALKAIRIGLADYK